MDHKENIDNTSYWLGFFLGFFFGLIGLIVSYLFSKEGNDIRRGAKIGFVIVVIFALIYVSTYLIILVRKS